MPFQKGQIANPNGGRAKHGRKALAQVRVAMNKAIDGLGDATHKGSTVMAGLITEALRNDVVGTLKALQGYMPKDDVQSSVGGIQVIIQRDNVSIQADGRTLDVATSEPVQAVIEGEVSVDAGVLSGDK